MITACFRLLMPSTFDWIQLYDKCKMNLKKNCFHCYMFETHSLSFPLKFWTRSLYTNKKAIHKRLHSKENSSKKRNFSSFTLSSVIVLMTIRIHKIHYGLLYNNSWSKRHNEHTLPFIHTTYQIDFSALIGLKVNKFACLLVKYIIHMAWRGGWTITPYNKYFPTHLIQFC